MVVDRLQVANAGVNETGDYIAPKVKDGKLEKPTMTTIDVNLMGTVYSEENELINTRHPLICIYPSYAPSYPLLTAQ